MNTEPLNIGTLQHYLNFKDDETGLVQIDVPIGFDGANFLLNQRDKGYGRDESFAGDEIDFVFTNTCNLYGFHFEKLIEYNDVRGSESNVEYILKEGDIFYVVGEIDFKTAITDDYLHFTCKIIQDTSQAALKRRIDTKVDVFSDKDLDDQDISPVQTQNVLIKGKPVFQLSTWNSINEARGFSRTISSGTTFNTGLNTANNTNNYGVQNTLSFISQLAGLSLATGNPNIETFTFIEAENNINDISIQIKNVEGYTEQNITDFFSDVVTSGSGSIRLVVKIGTNVGSITETHILYEKNYDFSEGEVQEDLPTSFSLELDEITSGNRLYIYFQHESTATFSSSSPGSLANYSVETILENIEVEVTATRSSIDIVVPCVRLIDGMTQVTSSINQEFNLSAPRFDLGGEWYDNFIYSGNMIRGKNNKFVLNWKDIASQLQEFNSDYETDTNVNTSERTVFVGKYEDFYTNNEIASFEMPPTDSFEKTSNERFAINEFRLKYSKFNQDKDDGNTIDAVHTETEWLNKNKNVENKKEINLPFIRDPFFLQTTIDKAIRENETSLTQDDNVFINDVVSLSPMATGTLKRSLTHLILDGNLNLLNDGSFNFSLLGFGVGSTINIVNTGNAGQYEVLEISNNIMILQGGTFSASNVYTEITFQYTNVNYVIRTNEGFNSITGITRPNEFGNLLYTPKRNIIDHWGSYLKTSTLYKGGIIKNTYFKNDGELETQFQSGDLIKENADITQDKLDDAILSPKIVTTNIICDFSQYISYRDKLKSIRGFVRVVDNYKRVLKIHPQKSDFTWAKNTMEIVGEIRHESDTLRITSSSGVLFINEVGYDENIIDYIEYNAKDNYIQIFDQNTLPLANRLRYDRVSVNGVKYENIVDLVTAIETL